MMKIATLALLVGFSSATNGKEQQRLLKSNMNHATQQTNLRGDGNPDPNPDALWPPVAGAAGSGNPDPNLDGMWPPVTDAADATESWSLSATESATNGEEHQDLFNPTNDHATQHNSVNLHGEIIQQWPPVADATGSFCGGSLWQEPLHTVTSTSRWEQVRKCIDEVQTSVMGTITRLTSSALVNVGESRYNGQFKDAVQAQLEKAQAALENRVKPLVSVTDKLLAGKQVLPGVEVGKEGEIPLEPIPLERLDMKTFVSMLATEAMEWDQQSRCTAKAATKVNAGACGNVAAWTMGVDASDCTTEDDDASHTRDCDFFAGLLQVSWLDAGASCTPRCETGYDTVNDTPRSCSNTGRFTDTFKCQPKSCASTGGTPQNGGKGNCPTKLESDKSCTPTCDKGYDASGERSCLLGALTNTFKCTPGSCASTGGIPQNGIGQYVVGAKGSMCPPSTKEIKTIEECQKVLKALGMDFKFDWSGSQTVGWTGSHKNIPPGCSYRFPSVYKTYKFKATPHFNTRSTGRGRNDLAPICLGVKNFCPAKLESGKSCTLTCHQGYDASGKRSCLLGELTNTFKCTPKPCASTGGTPRDGDKGNCPTKLEGDKSCTPTCDKGYVASGKRSCLLGKLTNTFQCRTDMCPCRGGIPPCRGEFYYGEAKKEGCWYGNYNSQFKHSYKMYLYDYGKQ